LRQGAKKPRRLPSDNALASALDQVFGYDDLDQLISADRGGGSTQDWVLDALGNWSSLDDNGTVRTRGVNAANEITSTTNLATPTYDRAGNMVSTPKPASPTSSWDVTYDAWNRVVKVTDGTTTIDYEYDGTDRRIERDDGAAEHSYYDGEQVIETQVPDGQGGFETDKQYVWSLRYIDSPILRDSYTGGVLQTGDRLYYLTDANQNVTAVTNNAGVVQERYDYDAYGKVTIYDAAWANPTTTSAVGNTLLFAGQDVDVATGLQYSRARWYSSSIGGFISRDPLGLVAGDFNVYRYVGNNPVIYVDPSGLMSLGARVATGATAGAVTGAATGAVAGGGAMMSGIMGGVFGAVSGALASPKASFAEVAAVGAIEGIVSGVLSGVAAGLRATTGLASRLGIPGGLVASERAGGHLLARHVGLSSMGLQARLASDPGLRAASTFVTRAEAEAAVAVTVEANALRVASWVSSGAGGQLRLISSTRSGMVLARGASSAVRGSGTKVVLQGNGSGGFHILTGFPIL